MANNWRESNLDFLHAGENSLQWKRNEEREEYDTLKKRNFISKCKERKKKAHVRVQFNFLRREKELRRSGARPVVFVHPRGFVLEKETSDNNGRP